jgi:hypothetical protein
VIKKNAGRLWIAEYGIKNDALKTENRKQALGP